MDSLPVEIIVSIGPYLTINSIISWSQISSSYRQILIINKNSVIWEPFFQQLSPQINFFFKTPLSIVKFYYSSKQNLIKCPICCQPIEEMCWVSNNN